MARYDVLVAGGGLGGLAAAVDLAREGRSVLVLEAGEITGGYAANFQRGPFRFDASLHLLDAVGPGEANRDVWERLNLHERVDLVCPPRVRRELWPEHELEYGQGIDAWLDALSEPFASERDGLRAFARLAQRVQTEVLADRDARLAGSSAAMGSAVATLVDRTAAQVLRAHLTDERLVAIVGTLSCYLGLGAEELAAIPFLTMFAGYHAGSGRYPAGGSGAIARALEAELSSLGGEIRTGSRVAGVPCERGVAKGVTLGSGERIEGDAVVANLSPQLLYGTLVDDVPSRFLRRLERAELGTSVVKIWLGCTRDPAPDLPYETFLRDGYRTTFTDGGLDDIDVVASQRVDPGCAPEGGAVLAVTVGTEADLGDDAQQRYRCAIEDAVEVVEQRLIPGLRASVDQQSIATPATFHRYTSSPGGTIHGFRPTPSQSGPRRLGVTGPIRGLYQVGGWTYAGSGFVPAMTSGLVAAAAIRSRLQ